MKDKFIDNIDDLKKKYEYDINDYEDYDNLCSLLSFKCYSGINELIVAIEILIKNLLAYTGQKINEAQKYLKEMNNFLKYYRNLKKQIFDNNIYYMTLIRDLHAQYQLHGDIKNIKQIYIKNIETILQLRVREYIKFDKEIINLFNIINDLITFFNF